MEGNQTENIDSPNCPPIYGSTKSKEPPISKGPFSPIMELKREENNFGFDITFVKRFYFLHKQLFKSFLSQATFLFIFLIGLVVGREFVVYEVGLIPGGYYLPLGNRDLEGFWKQTRKAVGLIVAISLVNSIVSFTRKILSVFFRKLLCDATHRAYFTDIKYFQLNVLDKTIDNPDQRMTQDIEKFCSTYCLVLPNLLVAPFTIGWYVRKGYQKSGWQGPVGCFGLFVVATIANKLLMTPVVNYVFKQNKREGDFRFMHMLVRVNSESIAFQQAAPLEKGKVEESMAKLLSTQRSLYFRQFFLELSTNLCDYIGSIFSYMMLAIPIFSGEYDDLGPAELSVLISENAFILIYLIFSFTSVVDLSAQFPEIAGLTHRISQLLERLENFDESSKNNDDTFSDNLTKWGEVRRKVEHNLNLIIGYQDHFTPENEEKEQKEKDLIIWSLENVTFSRPRSDNSLVSNLSMNFVVGENVLITGPSSAGKTSIFRLLRRLWHSSQGTLKHFYPPGPTGVYFCPQKCYVSRGTLREQISFPLLPDKSERSNKLIEYYIDKLKLSHLVSSVGGLDVNLSWTQLDSFSPGEVQRLCILRVLYHQPVVVVLDEITSALPHEMEDYMYSELKRLGITIISVGHRDSIRKYHDKQLIIKGSGEWELCSVDKNS